MHFYLTSVRWEDSDTRLQLVHRSVEADCLRGVQHL